MRKGSHLIKEVIEKIREARRKQISPMLGKHHTEETKRKLSKANLGKHHSEETKRKIGNSTRLRGIRRGWHLSKETRQKISEARKGTKLSEETKRKIGKANSIKLKGKHLSMETRRKVSEGNIGKIVSKETREKLRKANLDKKASLGAKRKMSEARKGKYGGKNAPNWRGGKSSLCSQIKISFEYRQWRSDIFTRDNFTCQMCGQVGGKLNAHHIKSFSSVIQKYEITTLEEALNCEELWNINNGITHCEKCHRETDNYGGRFGNNENTVQQRY